MKKIIMTNSSTIQGEEIIECSALISAHVVAGTNIFSDFFASFTDVLGGRSKTYKNQLESGFYPDTIPARYTDSAGKSS